MLLRRVLCLVLTVTGLTVLAPAPATPAVEQLAPGDPLVIAGPSRATIGQRLHLILAGGPTGASYAWDTDGDGTFETDTGTTAELVLVARPAMKPVAVRAVVGRQTQTASLPVHVVRPTTAAVVAEPADPKPGEKVTFRVLSRSDDDRYVAYAWDVEGVPTRRTTTTLDLPEDVSSAVQLALDAKGTGYQITAEPTLTVTMPDGTKNKNRIISAHVKPISENGSFDDLSRTIRLREFTPTVGGGPDPARGQTVNCDNPPELLMIQLGTCAAIGIFDAGLQDAPLQVRDATPGVKACYPVVDKEPEVKQTRITELKNLAYPPPEAIIANLETVTLPGGAGGPGRPTTVRKGKEECQPLGAQTKSFDFGDGTGFTVPSSAQDSTKGFVFEHTFTQPGTYTVTMTTKVPYFGGIIKEGSAFKVRWFTATKSATLTIGEALCGPLDVNGISATPVYEGAIKSGGGADLLATPCFIPETSLDGHKVYRPEAGYYVRLGNPVTGVTLVGDDVVVDPAQGTITAPTGMAGYYLSGEDNTGAGRPVTPVTTALSIPVPAYDPELGTSVVALPGRLTQNTSFEGLDVTSTQAFLRPGGASALVKISTALPRPLKGATPPIVLDGWKPYATSGGTSRALGALPPDTDYSVDLAGLQVGGFEIEEGLLAHKISGGWIAGVVLAIPGFGRVNAPYLPPPSGTPSSECRSIDGPSGLQLSQGGGFDFGGAQVELDDELPLGPAGAPIAGLSCLAASATGDPFVIVGEVGGSVPKNGFIKVDGCVAFGVLRTGQTGAGCDESFAAPSDVVWLRTTGQVSLGHHLDLGSGYVDLRVGSDYAAVGMGGQAHFAFANFTVDVGVDGSVEFAPSFAFSLIGSARICGSFLIDVCARVQGGVSSKGFGACFDLGGIVYLYDSGWDVFFASCDLKSYIGVQKQTRTLRSGTVATTMPPNTAEAAFVVTSSTGRPPLLQVIAPDGTVIADGGSDLQRAEDHTITKFPTGGVTTVTVKAPQPGAWQVRAMPETTCAPRGCTTTTPDIEVDLRTPIPDPVVTGTVSGSGDRRVLHYDVDADPGDHVVLTEEGSFGSRQLTVLDHGVSTFSLPTSGIAEKRTVTAVVERNGVPYKTITLDTYQAPAAPKLVAPAQLTLLTADSDTSVSWRAVPGATSYVVRAALADGRTLRQVVDGTSTVLRGVTGFTAGSVSVTATSTVGRESAPATSRLTPRLKVVRVL